MKRQHRQKGRRDFDAELKRMIRENHYGYSILEYVGEKFGRLLNFHVELLVSEVQRSGY